MSLYGDTDSSLTTSSRRERKGTGGTGGDTRTLERKIKKLEKQVAELEEDADTAKSEADKHRKKFRELDREHAELKIDFDQVKGQLEVAKKSGGGRADARREKELEDKLAEVEDALARKEGELKMERDEKRKIEANLEAAAENKGDSSEKLERVLKQKELVEKEVRDLEQKVEDEIKQRFRLEKDQEDLLHQLEQAKIDRETVSRQRTRVEEERVDMEKEIFKLKRRIAKGMNNVQQEAEIKVLNGMIEAETKDRVRTQQELDNAQKELTALRKELKDTTVQLENRRHDISELKVELEVEREAKAKYEIDKQSLQYELKDEKSKVRTLMDDLSSGDSKLQKAIQKMTEQMELQKSELVDAAKDKLELHNELTACRKRLYEFEETCKKQERTIAEMSSSDKGKLETALADAMKQIDAKSAEIYNLNDQMEKHVNRVAEETERRQQLEQQRKKQNMIIRELKNKLQKAAGDEMIDRLKQEIDPRAVREEMFVNVQELLHTVKTEIHRRTEAEQLTERVRDELRELKKRFGLIKTREDQEAEQAADSAEAIEARKALEPLARAMVASVANSIAAIDALAPNVDDDGAQLVDDALGLNDVFYADGPVAFPLPKSEHGVFFSGHAYVVHHSHLVRDGHTIYTWIGRDASDDEISAANEHAEKTSYRVSGKVTRQEVLQGKEPRRFLHVWKSKMVVNSGRRTDYDDDDVVAYQVVGTCAANTRTVACPLHTWQLNSFHCTIIKAADKLVIWSGVHASDYKKETAVAVGTRMQGARAQINIQEGSESEWFWSELDGKAGDYAHADNFPVDDVNSIKRARLFQVFPTEAKRTTDEAAAARGDKLDVQLDVKEVRDFTQDDVLPDHAIILDGINELYVWLGSELPFKEITKKRAMELAQEYVRLSDSHGPNTRIYYVKQDNEQPRFVRHFQSWVPQFWDGRKVAKRTCNASSVEVEKPDKVETFASADDAAAAYDGKYTLADLQQRDKLPATVDQARLEDYLRDDEFDGVFGMTRDELTKAPGWKRNKLKRAANLF